MIRCKYCSYTVNLNITEVRRNCPANKPYDCVFVLLDNQPQAGPSLIKKTINITKAVARVVSSSEPLLVSPETYEIRLKICDSCEFKNHIKESCTKCGCSLKGRIVNKTKYTTESCPVGKW